MISFTWEFIDTFTRSTLIMVPDTHLLLRGNSSNTIRKNTEFETKVILWFWYNTWSNSSLITNLVFKSWSNLGFVLSLNQCLIFSPNFFQLKQVRCFTVLSLSCSEARVGSVPLLLTVPFQAFSFSLVRGTWALPNPEEKVIRYLLRNSDHLLRHLSASHSNVTAVSKHVFLSP